MVTLSDLKSALEEKVTTPLDTYLQEHIRKLHEELHTLNEAADVVVPAATTDYEVLPSTDISKYKYKTVSIKADYALTFRIMVSDDGVTWDRYYEDTLTANELYAASFEEDFYYLKVLCDNPDAVDHVVSYVRVKGRRL